MLHLAGNSRVGLPLSRATNFVECSAAASNGGYNIMERQGAQHAPFTRLSCARFVYRHVGLPRMARFADNLSLDVSESQQDTCPDENTGVMTRCGRGCTTTCLCCRQL